MASPEDLINGGRFFEARRKIFPKAVDGSFRRLKWAIMAVTLSIYYLTPWLRWHRGTYAPDQAVLVDLAHRRFYMFGIEIWPHEFYYVTGLLVMAGIGLFLVTSAVGRAWCGYACPQTVWTDLLVHVERWSDGERNPQMRLLRAPWGPKKIARRAAKHGIWLAIGALTGGAWIFYFADAPTLFRQVVTGQAPMVAYATIGILTFTTYALGGLMREQVCIYMCPWPRIQGAMQDETSLIVTYKAWRGEPRSRGLKRAAHPSLAAMAEGEAAPAFGDCIDCSACVAVCPTGIDIREGAQIGCITCGLCIDACDDMMTKIGRPTRLIGYSTLADELRAKRGEPVVPVMKRLLRPRTLIYFTLWAGVGCGMLFALGTRTHLGISVLQNRNPLYVRLSDGEIRNNYVVKLRNMEGRSRRFEVAIDGVPGAVLWNGDDGAREGAGRSVTVAVAPDQVAKVPMFVAAPAAGEPRTDLVFTVRALDAGGGSATDRSFFERPGEGQ